MSGISLPGVGVRSPSNVMHEALLVWGVSFTHRLIQIIPETRQLRSFGPLDYFFK